MPTKTNMRKEMLQAEPCSPQQVQKPTALQREESITQEIEVPEEDQQKALIPRHKRK